MKRIRNCPPGTRRKRKLRGGFTYAEMVIVTLTLVLCTGVIGETLSLGAKHLRRQTDASQAVILLDTLRAVVSDELSYHPGLWTKYEGGTDAETSVPLIPAELYFSSVTREKMSAIVEAGRNEEGFWLTITVYGENGAELAKITDFPVMPLDFGGG